MHLRPLAIEAAIRLLELPAPMAVTGHMAATEAPLIRLPIEPSDRNGLRATSHLMMDKITTVSKAKLQTLCLMRTWSGSVGPFSFFWGWQVPLAGRNSRRNRIKASGAGNALCADVSS